jgi:two-component system LytT family response regulator
MTMALETATAFIVEDEPLARRRLRDLMRPVPWLRCIGEAANGSSAIAAINELEPDLLFLDIRLPDISGIDVLSRVKHSPAVIFTTAYDQFAVTAFELAAVDYLLKPFGKDRFSRAIERARPLVEFSGEGDPRARAVETSHSGPVPRLFVRDAGRIVPIRVAAIERVQAADDAVLVYAQGKQFRLNLTLAALEQRLDPDVFVRVHRSHLVNMDHVASWVPYDGSRFQITLRSGATLMSSRQRSRELRSIAR